MTYKLNPIIEKIVSPVNVILPDGKTRGYKNGIEAGDDVFDNHYVINEIRAVSENLIEIKISERKEPNGSNWIGEEQSFF